MWLNEFYQSLLQTNDPLAQYERARREMADARRKPQIKSQIKTQQTEKQMPQPNHNNENYIKYDVKNNGENIVISVAVAVCIVAVAVCIALVLAAVLWLM